MIRIVSAPEGMPIAHWTVLMKSGPAIGGFASAEAARAFATEWNGKDITIIPVVTPTFAAKCLARFEQARDERGFF